MLASPPARWCPPTAFRLFVVFAALALGCSKHASEGAGGAKTLRLSMIPTTDPGKLARESEPLVAYLEKKTGAKVELTVPLNYAAEESGLNIIARLSEGIAHFQTNAFVTRRSWRRRIGR